MKESYGIPFTLVSSLFLAEAGKLGEDSREDITEGLEFAVRDSRSITIRKMFGSNVTGLAIDLPGLVDVIRRELGQ